MLLPRIVGCVENILLTCIYIVVLDLFNCQNIPGNVQKVLFLLPKYTISQGHIVIVVTNSWLFKILLNIFTFLASNA